jgi:hypothetical protein
VRDVGTLTAFRGATKLATMAYSNQLIDKRVVERNIAKGLVDPEEYKKSLEALPDREAQAVAVSYEASMDDDDDDIDDIDDDVEEDDDVDDDEEGDEGDEG